MNTRSEALRSHLTDQVLALHDALTATDNDVQELQAALRGYILTQQPGFLAQYREAQASLAPQVDPLMEAQVGELADNLERWQREVGEHQVALVQQGRTELVVQQIASSQSKELFAAMPATSRM